MTVTFRDLHDDVVGRLPMSAEQIAQDLTDRIGTGEYKQGEQLPTYAVLADLYGVSESTITKVIALLRERKIVVGIQGRGTFVPYRASQ